MAIKINKDFAMHGYMPDLLPSRKASEREFEVAAQRPRDALRRWGSGAGSGGQEVPGGADEQREFGALHPGGDGVAADRGGEAALRAQREPFSIDHRACLARAEQAPDVLNPRIQCHNVQRATPAMPGYQPLTGYTPGEADRGFVYEGGGAAEERTHGLVEDSYLLLRAQGRSLLHQDNA